MTGVLPLLDLTSKFLDHFCVLRCLRCVVEMHRLPLWQIERDRFFAMLVLAVRMSFMRMALLNILGSTRGLRLYLR